MRGEAEQVILASAEKAESSTLDNFYAARLQDFFAAPRNVVSHLLASNRPLFSLLTDMENLERYLDASGRTVVGELRELVLKKDDLDFQYSLQLILQIWLLVHVPVTYSLLVLAIVHFVLALAFSGGL